MNFKVFAKYFLLLFLIFLSSTIYAKNSRGHNEDLLYIIYGYEDYDTFEKKVSDSEKLSYWIVSDATAFAIDENGMGKTKDKYQSLQDNLKSTTKGKSLLLPPYSDFPNTGGGQHRAYNHQGFYWDYSNKWIEQNDERINPYLNRWILGRDKILIPSVAVAFGLNIGAPEAEAIAVITYYCHILGDEYQGKTNQMETIASFYYMLSQLKYDLMDAIKKVGGVPFYYYNNEIVMNDIFGRVQRSVRSCKSKETAFYIAKKFMRNEMPIIIEKLIGKSISNVKIL